MALDSTPGRREPVHDYLILGAGPAGLQLGHFLERAGRDYLIVEGGEGPGTFFRTFPRPGRVRIRIGPAMDLAGKSSGEIVDTVDRTLHRMFDELTEESRHRNGHPGR